jgi:hypothetical protein
VTTLPSSLIPARNAHIVWVCDRLREDEQEQYEAFTGTVWQPEEGAAMFIAKPGPKFTILDAAGIPAAVGGYEEVMRGVWQSWMCGTDDGWRDCWRSITKGSRWVADQLLGGVAHRLQTNCLASRVKTMEWYERGLGLKREGVMRKLGNRGEDAVMFSLTKEDRHGRQQ